MARKRQAATTDDLGEIEDYYRRRLTAPAEMPAAQFRPVFLGPTWQIEGGRWVLPDRSLGWSMLAWCGRWLQVSRDEPWRFTDEQARFLLWWYALDERGVFLFRDGVLQRLKGWGKDPVGACLSGFEMLGPARFATFEDGRPVGVDVESAWVQTAAVSLEQTKNTMRLFPGLFTPEAKEKFRVQVGKEQVHALGDQRLIQAVTSSPATLEGARATFVLLNETHHWTASNAGLEMAAVIERNATKSADGAARTLRITNAYEPGEGSVAELDREAWESVQSGSAVDSGLLYDSLEAPPDAPLTLDAAPAVVESIRGDAKWLDVARIVASISDVRNPPSRSRRFWYNQITAAEDAWTTPQEWDGCADRTLVLSEGDEVAAFFDGSKSDDATGLAVARMSDGAVFLLNGWAKPAGDRGKGWIVPRGEVDAAVESLFDNFRPVAFYADPSDTRDDTGERFWEPIIDDWHRRFGPRLKVWATAQGRAKHSVSWDMRSPERARDFTAATERALADLQAGDFPHNGDRRLRAHALNARRRPGKYGVGIGKEHRESPRKIDFLVCAIGARMARRDVLNGGTGKRQRTGKVW